MRNHCISSNDSYTATCSIEKGNSGECPLQVTLQESHIPGTRHAFRLWREFGTTYVYPPLFLYVDLGMSDPKSWPLGLPRSPCCRIHRSPLVFQGPFCWKPVTTVASELRLCQGQRAGQWPIPLAVARGDAGVDAALTCSRSLLDES